MNRLARRILQIGAADQMDEIGVTLISRRDQHQRRYVGAKAALAAASRVLALIFESDVHLTGDDRLHAVFHRLLCKLERAEQIVRVGDGDGRHLVPDGVADNLAERQRPFQQRVGRMHAQMDERPCRPDRTRRQRLGFAFQRIAGRSVVHASMPTGLGKECKVYSPRAHAASPLSPANTVFDDDDDLLACAQTNARHAHRRRAVSRSHCLPAPWRL